MKDFVLLVGTPCGDYSTKKVEKVFENINIKVDLIRKGINKSVPEYDITFVAGKYGSLDELNKVRHNAKVLGYKVNFLRLEY